MLKHYDHKELGREGFTWLMLPWQSIAEGGQSRRELMQTLWRMLLTGLHFRPAHSASLWPLMLTPHMDHQLKYDITHSGRGSPTAITNFKNALQVCLNYLMEAISLLRSPPLSI